MKIAIDDNIIETADIYKIGPVESKTYGHIYHCFTIHFFKGKELDVEIYSSTYISCGYVSIVNKNGTEKKIYNNGTIDDCRKSASYQKSLTKLTKLREDIIKIWSENQSNIPKFSTT